MMNNGSDYASHGKDQDKISDPSTLKNVSQVINNHNNYDFDLHCTPRFETIRLSSHCGAAENASGSIEAITVNQSTSFVPR